MALNFICAEAFKDVIEYSRATFPRKTGVLWWSLYDMWPMLFNYSVIDCDGNRKLPYYWIRQSQQDVALMAVRENLGDAPTLYVANSTLQKTAISYTVTAYNANGESREVACGELVAAPNANAAVMTLAEGQSAELWVIRWVIDGRESVNHFFTGKADSKTCRRWIKILADAADFDLKELY